MCRAYSCDLGRERPGGSELEGCRIGETLGWEMLARSLLGSLADGDQIQVLPVAVKEKGVEPVKNKLVGCGEWGRGKP